MSNRSLRSLRSQASSRFSTFSSEDGGPEWNMNILYGRDNESQIIQEVADKETTNILVLHGVAGSGKSALVEAQPWEEDGWVFAAGRYEKPRSNEPYSALIDALNNLVDQWTVYNSTASICQMGAFHHLLEEDVEFLRNILPKAFQVSGTVSCHQQVPTRKRMSAIGGTAASGAEYVNASFWRILSFLCKPNPVVLFLDDLQWADQASLNAIKTLATTGNVEGLLLAVAYRDEEVEENDPVSDCLQYVKEEGESVHTIHVKDLDQDNVNQIVSKLLRQDPETTSELSRVIHSKTLGNPFFVIQFMQMLRQERFLTYSLMSLRWEWGEVDKMEQLAHVSDNVADVIAVTMKKLPHPSLLALKTASCLGKVIPLQIMVEYFDTVNIESNAMICNALKSVELNGLKHYLDWAIKVGILTRSENGQIYMWAHDKLQQVAYSMIPECYRKKIHISLGKLLWKMSSEKPEDEWILYMAADQLNRYSLEYDDGLGEDVARLSYEAGKLSMAKSAFLPAFEMMERAATHIRALEEPWLKAYDLCLDIYNCLAEVSVRLGKFEEAERSVTEVVRHAKTLEEKFRAQAVMVRCQISDTDRDYLRGVELIQEILQEYGVKFPQKLLPGQQFFESKKLKSKLGGKLESLLDIRQLNDDNNADRRTHNVMIMLSDLAFFASMRPEKRPLAFFAVTRALNMSITHGICPETAMALAGLVMNPNNEVSSEEAIECGELAIKLVDTFPQELGSAHTMVRAAVVSGILSAYLPFNNALDPYLEVNKIGLKTGDTEKASMGLVGYSFSYLCVGLPFDPLESDLSSFSREARQFGMAPTIQVLFPIFRQTIHNLKVFQNDPTLLKGDIFDQEKEIVKFSGQGRSMTERDINTFRLMLACIYHRWEVAAELVNALEQYLGTDHFVARRHIRLTYMGIACIVSGRKATKRKSHYRQLGKKIIKLFREDLKMGSQNAFPIVALLEAIETSAKEKFDGAIRTTARLGLIQHQALLYELAGINFLEQEDEGWGEYYLSRACNLYSDWGATGKTEQLKQDYHHLLKTSSLSLSEKGSSLKGRTRYDPEAVNQLKEVDWSSSGSVGHGSIGSSFEGSLLSSNETNKTSLGHLHSP